MSDILTNINESIDFIRKHSSVQPEIAVTLGSGLSHFADSIEVDVTLPYGDIPHFAPPSIEGHPGRLILGSLNQIPVAVLQGRVHYYEGHSYQEVVHSTRVVGKLGCETLILTNSAGGFADGMKAGDFMLIRDHLNLTGSSPLIGHNCDELGPRFPDMSEVYDKEFLKSATKVMKEQNLNYHVGVYCGVTGPAYETPAEIQFLKSIGGGAVGMSTVPEAIAAKHMGLKIAGVSCITNLAAGISHEPLSHEEVKEVANQVAQGFCQFLESFIKEIA